MKIPGITTILLYQLEKHKQVIPDENIRLFPPSDLAKDRWILKYFPEKICIKRWHEGNKLFYLLDKENTPFSFAWIKNGTGHFVGELNKTLVFPINVNCIFDCVTPEKFRGNGYYPLLIKKLAEMNEAPSIIYASWSNIPSNKGIVKAGFELTHKIFRVLNFVKIIDLNNSGINFNVRKAH